MKKTIRAVGAAGLAAATIVTGLSFGPAASRAETSDTASSVGGARLTGKLVTAFRNPISEWYGVGQPSKGVQVRAPSSTSLAGALRSATNYEIPGLDETGPVIAENGLCLQLNSEKVVGATCDGSESQQWTLKVMTVAFGRSAESLVPVSAPTATLTSNGALFVSAATDSIVVDHLKEVFSAIVTDADPLGGTATVSGSAPKTASNVLVEWTDENGRNKQKYVSVSGGKYSTLLSGLPIGSTNVSLTALYGSEELAATTVAVKLEVAPVTATATFDAAVDTVVQVSGNAQPNAKVSIRHGERDIVTVTANADGEWSTPVNPPNAPGVYNLSAGQEIRGQDNGRVNLDVDYGPGVEITSPGDDFELDPGETLAIKGNAQAGARIAVHEKGEQDELASVTASGNGSYLVPITGLQDREYKLLVESISKGHNRTTAELTVNQGKSSVTNPTAEVEFDADFTKKATVKGTGAAGGTITVKDEDGNPIGGPVEVVGNDNGIGAWSTEIDPVGPDKHTLTVEQTGVDRTQSVALEVDFGAPVSAAGPDAAFEGSTTTITGTGADGAHIVISENNAPVASGTVEDGAFSIPVEKIQDGEHTYEVTQTAQGNTVSSTEVTVTRDAAVTPVTLTSPRSGDSYPKKSTVRFTGTGTPGATVLLDAFGGLADYSTQVGWDGNWIIDRPMNIGTYRFDVVQTAKGQESRVDGIELVEEGTPVDRPFKVTAPTSGSTHKDELVTFEGDGTPGSKITIDPKVPGLKTTTVTVELNGKWSVDRWLGTGAYDFDVYQTSPEGNETGRTDIQINQPASVTRPFAVTSPRDNTDHKNEKVTFTGTGTPGSDVLVHVSNFTSADVSATVQSNGYWQVDKWLGSGTYVIDVTQKTDGVLDGTTTLHLNNPDAPVDKPFEITSHKDGDTFVPDHEEQFRGTGAAGALITIDPGNGLKAVTTEVRSTGDWQVGKWLGNGSYTFTVSQTKNGETTTLMPFTITPTK